MGTLGGWGTAVCGGVLGLVGGGGGGGGGVMITDLGLAVTVLHVWHELRLRFQPTASEAPDPGQLRHVY